MPPLKPQDIAVALQLALTPGVTYAALAAATGLSQGEVHNAVRRLRGARLVLADAAQVHATALMEFLDDGVPSIRVSSVDWGRARVRTSRTSSSSWTSGRASDHHRCIPSEPRQLRPLHRRLSERRAELLLIQRQDIRRERHCILHVQKRSRPKRRLLRQRLREFHIPWADGLGDVSV